MTFGTWLKDQLIRAGTTQQGLAEALDKSDATVSRWVLDQRKPPPPQCHAIGRLLGVPANEVLFRAGYLEDDSGTTAVQAGIGHSGGVQVVGRKRSATIAGAVFVPVLGHVPSTSKLWSGSMNISEFQLVPPEYVVEMGNALCVIAGDDALSERGIKPGSHVLFDSEAQPTMDGDMVVVRTGDAVLLREWRTEDVGYRLRDYKSGSMPVYVRDEDAAEHICIMGVVRAFGWWQRL